MKTFLTLLLFTAQVLAVDATIPNDTVNIGKKAAGDKTLVFQNNAGAANPKLKWNNTTSRFEFANDGVNYSAFGSGSGGGSGINLLTNGGFESGTTEWSASAGTFATTSTAANVGAGLLAGSWTPAASTNTLGTSQKTLVAGLYGRNCLGKILYKKTANVADHALRVIDGSSNVLASVALPQATTYTQAYVTFVCPTSGTAALQVVAGGTDAIFVDEAHLGENFLVSNVSQASMFGGVNWPIAASCIWVKSTNAFANFSADSDCTFPSGSGLRGNAIAPATKVPGIRFTSMPPGEYLFVATGRFYRTNVNFNTTARFSDGTNSSAAQLFHVDGTNAMSTPVLMGRIAYTTAQGDTTIQIQVASDDNTNASAVDATLSPLDISVYRFPTQVDQALKVDQVGWHVDANISGANPALGSSDITSYTEIVNSSLTMTQNSGSIGVQIPCSTTNPSTGLTCAAGSESVGVVYTQPVAGPVLACVNFAHAVDIPNGADVTAAFQIVETPNSAQTILSEGNSRMNSRQNIGSGDQSMNNHTPIRVCGVFNFSSAGQKTLRLMYEQDVGGSPSANEIKADALSTVGQRDIHWEVYPIGQFVQQPIIVNSVSSNGSGPWRIESALLTCSGSSSIQSQTGTWISSIGNIGAGNCTVTFAAGAFSAAPFCVMTQRNQSNPDSIFSANSVTSSSFSMDCDLAASGTDCTSFDAYLMCMGAR